MIFHPTYINKLKARVMRLVVKEPKTRVNEDYSQLIAGLNHNLVSSRTGWSGNIRHATLGGKEGGIVTDFQNTMLC